jgi:hypothetical protein
MDMPSLVFDFHATTAFDFFSAMYFFKARRLFCLLRLCEFFRASCFMLILLVRRDKPAGCFADESSARRRVSHRVMRGCPGHDLGRRFLILRILTLSLHLY